MESLRLATRTPWEDRFAHPCVRDLLGALSPEHHTLIQHARQCLSSLPHIGEHLAWQGIPWRWCFAYRADSAEPRSFAYVVPQPSKPVLALPIDSDIIAELPVKKLSKHIREVLSHAPLVGGVRWCQWDLTSKSQIDDIVNLARLKLPDESQTSS